MVCSQSKKSEKNDKQCESERLKTKTVAVISQKECYKKEYKKKIKIKKEYLKVVS